MVRLTLRNLKFCLNFSSCLFFKFFFLQYRVDEERIVKNIQHEIPWGLISPEAQNINKQTLVQVVEGLSADRIDMSVVRDEFTPASFSLSGWLGGWVSVFKITKKGI